MDWFEDEDFWSSLYPAMFPPDRFRIADQQVKDILGLTGLNGGAVLDLCCGPGRHAVSFAQQGFRVTAVDRSKFLLDRARERSAEFQVEVEWVEQDMRSFSRPDAFDLACSIFTSFGYFDDERDNLQVLRNVCASLVPGGAFVIDVMGKERAARSLQNALCNTLEDGTVVVQRPEVRADWTRIRNEWILIKDGHARSFTFEHTIYSGKELKDLLLQAGFAAVNLYGDLEGRPYGLEATRLVGLARKPL